MCSTPFGIIGILTAHRPTHLFAMHYESHFGHSVVPGLNRLSLVSSEGPPPDYCLTNLLFIDDASIFALLFPKPTPLLPFVSLCAKWSIQSTSADACADQAKSNGRESSNHDSGRLCSPTCRSQISQRLKISKRSSVASNISSSSQRSFSICRRVSRQRKIEY